MLRFTDREGREWDVVLGRESWGANVALFVPRVSAEMPVRQASLTAVAYDSAMQELNSLDQQALQALFDRSAIRQEGA